VGSLAARSIARREVAIDIAGPTGNGELYRVVARPSKQRPLLSLTLHMPAVGGRPGITSVHGLWERQTYSREISPAAGRDTLATTQLETRRRIEVSHSDWYTGSLRVTLALARDEFAYRGSFASFVAAADHRWLDDRTGAEASVSLWRHPSRRDSFARTDLIAWARTDGDDERVAWQGSAGLMYASRSAPLALWSGAGVGLGRDPLLRAHPLLRGDIIQAGVFGRSLAFVNCETRVHISTLGPLQLGGALFVDAADAWDCDGGRDLPWRIDAGTGLRLRGAGNGEFRLDLARGLVDDAFAVSVGWRAR
jgi:hypothetical protein